MTTHLLITCSGILLLCAAVSADGAPPEPITWTDARTLTVEGRGWADTAEYYHRLPAKARQVVSAPVWALSKHSAGMVVRFVSDSPEIHVRWHLIGEKLEMWHMPSTGVSGIDLYVRVDGKWKWLAMGMPSEKENQAKMVSGLKPEKREYALYLPLYNGVTSVEIGVAPGSSIGSAGPRTRNIKPVVFYGSSILQGGCASRPGMAFPSIIGRWLDIPTINLGFSGHGTCEPEMVDLMAELDPSIYVIDCIPNMTPDTVDERIRYLLKTFKAKHPNTPVILVEQVPFQSVYTMAEARDNGWPKNVLLRKVYEDNRKDWGGLLHYVRGNSLMGDDNEGTVDSVHATDLGFMRTAEKLAPVIKKVLDKTASQ